jgi:hypothetical protein
MDRCIPEGTEITCPGCHYIMLVASKDVYPGDRIGPSSFTFAEFYATPGERLACPNCCEEFCRIGPKGVFELHTESGWV